MQGLFHTLLTQPLTNVLVGIYQLLHSLGLPYALGFSIILLTVFIRLLISPLIATQMKASKKMQELQPHLNALKDRHKNDAQKMQQETLRLYQEHGFNPASGCLPVLIQLPVIWGLYSVLSEVVRQTSYKAINALLYTDSLHLKALWDTAFFGLPLGKTPAQLYTTYGPAIFLVPVVTGALQFVQSKMMATKPVAKKEKTKTDEPDFASMLQLQTTYLIPAMVGFFAWSLPFGLSLYWNTFTIFGIIQQYLLQKNEKTAPVVTVLPPEKKKKK